MRSLFLLFISLGTCVVSFSQNPEDSTAMSDGIFGLLIGDLSQAEKDLTRAISYEKGDELARAYYFRGKAIGGQKRYDEAITDFNKSIELKDDDPGVYQMRGVVYMRMKKYEKSMTDYNKVIEMDANYEDIYIHRGLLYRKLEKYDESVKDLKKACELDPENAEAVKELGLTYLLDYQDENACNMLSKAKKMGARKVQDLIDKYCNGITISEENKPDEYSWSEYSDQPMIDAANAKDITSFSIDDPESMITFFYASKIRQDDKWKEVLAPKEQWSSRLSYSLEKYENWKFTKFQLRRKKRYSDRGWWFEIYIEIEVQGKTDGGTDECDLRFDGSKWSIATLPN